MSDSLVPVARFIDWSEAHIACGFLRTNDIGAVLYDQNTVQANWPWAHALGGIKLMVPPRQKEQALQLLREVRAGGFADTVEGVMPRGGDEDFAIERCPSCDGEDIFRPRSLLGAIAGWLVAAPTPFVTRRRHCRRCGHEWSASVQTGRERTP